MSGLQFEELDRAREWMLSEFEEEWARVDHFAPTGLTPAGLDAFPDLLREAMQVGTDVSLMKALTVPGYWNPTNAAGARWTPENWAKLCAGSEFNTWYVRGLCRLLMAEGVERVQVYRAGTGREWNRECSRFDEKDFPVQEVYKGHRARYWPAKNLDAFSIPWTPGCHHSIRRVPESPTP